MKPWQMMLMMQQGAAVPVAAYRYWRLDFAPAPAGFLTSVDELTLSTELGGGTVTTPSTPVVASSIAGAAYAAARVVDGLRYNSGSGTFPAWASKNPSQPEFLILDLLAVHALVQIGLWAGEYTNCKTPGTFAVSGSNTANTGPWTQVQSFSGPARDHKTGLVLYNI